MRIAIQPSWSSPVEISDAKFLRSWFVYDSLLDDGEPRRPVDIAFGMLLVGVISAGFWTGVGLLVEQIWK